LIASDKVDVLAARRRNRPGPGWCDLHLVQHKKFKRGQQW